MADFVINNSYPYIEGLKLIDIFEEPKPLGLFSIDNSYPYYEGLKLINVLEDPKPIGIFQIDNGYPFLEGRKLIKILEKPYPLGVPIIDTNMYPKYDNLNPLITGAFIHASNLDKVFIPKSVKSIGKWAFTYTKLKEVTIAEDCTFFDTSFPEGCKINYYPSSNPDIPDIPEEIISNFITADGLQILTRDGLLFTAKE